MPHLCGQKAPNFINIVQLNERIMMSLSVVVSIIVSTNFLIGVVKLFTAELTARYGLAVEQILLRHEYGRLWSASWIHAHWSHLLLNTLMLAGIGFGILWPFGAVEFLFLYFISLLGGNLLALYTYRADQSGQYDATGAAGGISGVLLAGIALHPSLALSLPGVGSLPVWPLAIAFLVASVFALKPYHSTMIHDAHLGGAITGLLVTPLIAPEVLQDTLGIAVGILAPTVVAFYAWVKAPENIVPEWQKNTPGYPGWETEEPMALLPANSHYETAEDEMNALLDKISQQGYRSLSHHERVRLRSVSGEAPTEPAQLPPRNSN